MAKRVTRSSARNRRRMSDQPLEPGQIARQGDIQLRTYAVGALPLINRLLNRMQLEKILRQYLPKDDPRTELATSRALLVLVRNLLLSREPVYGIPEWAARFAPDLLDLYVDELPLLHDDRLGRVLHRLFEASGPDLLLAIVRHVIGEFNLSLDELHNDSTTVSFYGAYEDAREEQTRNGRHLPAITWGHSKARRPDLKQLLYTLTITDDGGVPLYFTSSSGNTVDDTTHRATWDLLVQLVGRPDFLYVADCKLASSENLRHLANRGGRFITVLPRNNREDKEFRGRLQSNPDSVCWQFLYEVTEDNGDVVDRYSVCADNFVTSDGFRLLWYHSARKAGHDLTKRSDQLRRAIELLTQLRDRLLGPRTRFRDRKKVEHAVHTIMNETHVEQWLRVTILTLAEESFRQAERGRPTENTRYVREVRERFSLSWELDTEALAVAERDDGVFPLITNDRELTAREILAAYKRQPIIEKRFSQLKTDFALAPILLKDIGRIQGLLAAYFLALLVQTLLERELRQAMAKAGEESLPMYPEARACKRPTARRVLDVLDTIQRHVLVLPNGDEQTLRTELNPLQQQIINLLGLSPATYGAE